MGVNPPPKPVNPEPQAIMGEVVPPDEVETLKRFRLSFFPDARIASQETYAKWLFGLTTTIAALGTGFSNAAFSKLSGWAFSSTPARFWPLAWDWDWPLGRSQRN